MNPPRTLPLALWGFTKRKKKRHLRVVGQSGNTNTVIFTHQKEIFHLIYIQWYHSYIVIPVSEWCLVRLSFYFRGRLRALCCLSCKKKKMLQLDFAGLWGARQATAEEGGGSRLIQSDISRVHYTLYIYKSTGLPNHGMLYRKPKSTQTLLNRIIYS